MRHSGGDNVTAYRPRAINNHWIKDGPVRSVSLSGSPLRSNAKHAERNHADKHCQRERERERQRERATHAHPLPTLHSQPLTFCTKNHAHTRVPQDHQCAKFGDTSFDLLGLSLSRGKTNAAWYYPSLQCVEDKAFDSVHESHSRREPMCNVYKACLQSAWRGTKRLLLITSCAGGRHKMPTPPASWPLTFWPRKWCPSHVWRGLPLCQC